MLPIKTTTNSRPAATADGTARRQLHEHTAKRSPVYRLPRHRRHSATPHGTETRYRPPYGCSRANTDSFHDPLKSP